MFSFSSFQSQEKNAELEDKTTKTSDPIAPPSTDSPVPEPTSNNNVNSSSVTSDVPVKNLSPSLKFLRTAHEHLGRLEETSSSCALLKQ